MMEYIQAFFFAFLATVAFGVLFQGPKRILWGSGLIGGLGWVVFIGLKGIFSIHSFSANFLATVIIALASEIFARLQKEPVTAFEIPAIIPLVPGLGMYKGMTLILQDYAGHGLLRHRPGHHDGVRRIPGPEDRQRHCPPAPAGYIGYCHFPGPVRDGSGKRGRIKKGGELYFRTFTAL